MTTHPTDYLNDWFEAKLADKKEIARRSEEFHRLGYTKYKRDELVPPDVMEAVVREADALLEGHGIRRDLNMETTEYSPRQMRNVPQRFIESAGRVIPLIYNSVGIRKYFGAIAGDDLVSCWKDEEYVINRLEKSGDTHGWHWGDYPFTTIWVLEAPPIEFGGLLQCIPHTTWNKQNPQINKHLAENRIDSYYHASREAYFLRSDTTLHRVTSVRAPNDEPVRRTILNTCWASANDARGEVQHETVHAAFM